MYGAHKLNHRSQTPNSSELGAFFSASLANPCEKVRVNAKTCGPRREVGFGLFGPIPLRLPGFSEASWVRAIPKSASSVRKIIH